jgi:hypothetical protein
MLELWGDIGFLVFTGSSLLFTLLYLTSSRWYKSIAALIIALFIFSVDIICVYLSFRIWDIVIPGVEWVRLTIFWTLGILMLTSIVAFLEIQFGRRQYKWRTRISKRYTDVNDRPNVTEGE